MKKSNFKFAFLLLAMIGKPVSADCNFSQVERQCIVDMVYHEARGQPHIEWVIIADSVCGRKLSAAKYHSVSKHACDIVKSPEYHSNGSLLSRKTDLKAYGAIKKAIFGTKSFKGSYDRFYHVKVAGKMMLKYGKYTAAG